MPRKNKSILDPRQLWSTEFRTPTAARDLDSVLGAVVNLPVKFWRRGFFFFGADDERLSELSDGRFPAVVVPDKSHPVFTLHSLPDQVGFTVCPCSSRRPFNMRSYRFISEGCQLMHTHYIMDRNSFLVENIRINVPPDLGYRLRFRGEVPNECIYSRSGSSSTART